MVSLRLLDELSQSVFYHLRKVGAKDGVFQCLQRDIIDGEELDTK